MKKLLLISLLVLLQGCVSGGGSREDLFTFFEIYNGECKYAYIVDEDLANLCTTRFVHAQSKKGTYYFVYYFEGKVQIVIAGDKEVVRDNQTFMNVIGVSFLSEKGSDDDVSATGQCGLVLKDGKRFSVCKLTANNKKLEFIFHITERVQ